MGNLFSGNDSGNAKSEFKTAYFKTITKNMTIAYNQNFNSYRNQSISLHQKDFVTVIARLSFMIYLIHPFFLDLIKTELHYTKWSTYAAIPVFTLMTFGCAWLAAAMIAFIKGKFKLLTTRKMAK